MEHEDASQSIFVTVTPADSLVGVTVSSRVNSGRVENEDESEDLRDNELSGVSPLEGVSFSTNVNVNSVSQAAVSNVSVDNGSQAAVNQVLICSGSQVASQELIPSCGSQMAAYNVRNSNDSQAAANKVISSGSQAAVQELIYSDGSQAAETDLSTSNGRQVPDDSPSPSPSPVHSQVLLDSTEMEFEVCSRQRKCAHSSSDDVEDGFRKPRTPITKGVKKQASSAPNCPRSVSPAGRGQSRSPRASGAVHQHLPASVSAVPLNARRP